MARPPIGSNTAPVVIEFSCETSRAKIGRPLVHQDESAARDLRAHADSLPAAGDNGAPADQVNLIHRA
jgi:hypothetical protein